MYCDNCGLEIKKGSNFCSNCGKQIKEISEINVEKVRVTGFFLIFCFICPIYALLKIFAIYVIQYESIITGIWYFELLNAIIAILSIVGCILMLLHKRIGLVCLRASLLFSLLIDIGLIAIQWRKSGTEIYLDSIGSLVISILRIIVLVVLLIYFYKSNRSKYYYQQMV